MKHIIDDADKNKYEAYTKQEVLALIQEAAQSGELPEEINGLVLTFKNPIDNATYKIAFCTQAKYNELKAGGYLETNCYYYITDDSTLDDLERNINDLESRTSSLEETNHLYRHSVRLLGQQTISSKTYAYDLNCTIYTNSNESITASNLHNYFTPLIHIETTGEFKIDGELCNNYYLLISGLSLKIIYWFGSNSSQSLTITNDVTIVDLASFQIF